MLHGKHFVAGAWVGSKQNFENQPVSGAPNHFAAGDASVVKDAVDAAENDFEAFSRHTRRERAQFLRTIAYEIESRSSAVVAMGVRETGLPQARLQAELGRTTAQLRLFADHIETGDYLDLKRDNALPDREPLPRPDLRLIQLPVGPVGVFGASNFPLAFSVAGGDTASALAAGCPVIVKGHEAHPGTGELVAQAIEAAMRACGVPKGTFSLVQGGSHAVGEALVKHPNIKAVGFTGSLGAGRVLFNLCAARPEPIPFFGELGSINPLFVMEGALASRADKIAQGWIASLTMGVGQFCTKPGVLILQDGEGADAFVSAAIEAMRPLQSQQMLTQRIANAYVEGCNKMAGISGVRNLMSKSAPGRQATGDLFEVSAQDWLANDALADEVFGPFGLIVRAKSFDQVLEIARHLEGQLTCTLHMQETDIALANPLIAILTRKAGRIIANGYPTGVEVAQAMVHGGPYPASTNFGATSVGTMAIRRWLRPVCFQNMSASLLPADAQ
ncbi:MAG: aldehyde dehydrogenase (NADP(+)) [Pseudomonadota bacterium]